MNTIDAEYNMYHNSIDIYALAIDDPLEYAKLYVK